MILENSQRIAMVGIGGSGMRGLAFILAEAGKIVSGTDRDLPTDEVHPAIKLLPETEMGPIIELADFVVRSDAVPPDHPLVLVAEAKGKTVMVYYELLGELSRQKQTIAVTGTHGKSSTTSMLAHIFIEAGLDPTALVGAGVPAWSGKNARVGQSPWFIVEADEYRNHFLSLTTESAIITSIDFDHPDFFASLADVESSFTQFIQRLSPKGHLVVPIKVVESFKNIPWPATLQSIDPPTQPIELVLPGQHMQYNAWLAIQLAQTYGISEDTSRHALAAYTGLHRRFERIGTIKNMAVVSDYGHHPAEIAATLAAAREQYTGQRICVVFEAHTRERLVQLLPDFIQALGEADGLIIVPPFIPPGREKEQRATGEAVAHVEHALKEQGKEVTTCADVTQLSDILAELSSQYDLALAFSAGRLDTILRSFVKTQ